MRLDKLIIIILLIGISFNLANVFINKPSQSRLEFEQLSNKEAIKLIAEHTYEANERCNLEMLGENYLFHRIYKNFEQKGFNINASYEDGSLGPLVVDTLMPDILKDVTKLTLSATKFVYTSSNNAQDVLKLPKKVQEFIGRSDGILDKYNLSYIAKYLEYELEDLKSKEKQCF